ncbi:MAG: prevent-host-death protein [Cyanobacteria bacterium P01_G01_bin.54]
MGELVTKILAENAVTIIRQPNQDPVAMLPAQELGNLLDTLHLLRSPTNAQRLFSAMSRAEAGQGIPQSLDELRTEVTKACEQA